MSTPTPHDLPIAQIGAQFKYWIAQNQQLSKDKAALAAQVADLQAKLHDKQHDKKMIGDIAINVAHVDFKLF
jgi:hypothetical protein